MSDDETLTLDSVELAAANQEIERARDRLVSIQRSQTEAQRAAHRKIPVRAAAHWFALVAAFDPLKIEAVTVEDSGFMMGMLDDVSVVEVATDMPQARIDQMGAVLNELGIKALIVRRGIQFLKLRACDAAEERKLNEIALARDAAARAASEAAEKQVSLALGAVEEKP